MRGMFKGVVARMWYMGANSLCVITAYEVRAGAYVSLCSSSTAREIEEYIHTMRAHTFRHAPCCRR